MRENDRRYGSKMRAAPPLVVTDKAAHAAYREQLTTHLRWYYGDCLGLPAATVADAISARLSRSRGDSLATHLDRLVGLEGRQMLDVGSGWGELVLAALARGADACGVEPDPVEVSISELLLRSYGVSITTRQGVGESLAFPDAHFDLVTCQQVLEHVDDIERVVSEIVRVTRSKGYIFVSTPNYFFPYEGHYRIKWFPMTPKPIGKIVLKARRRNPDFLLNHVNYTNYLQLRRLWSKHDLTARNITDEMLRAGEHPGAIYSRKLVRLAALHLKLYPNISWLLRKP
jgi:2-polyprenyl-3-methyl-5-hydroxy-6-metoxy-1,4-benzoquinol methylase